jgi:hypothetical protein
MGYWDLVPASVMYDRPPRTPAHDFSDLGWWGLLSKIIQFNALAALLGGGVDSASPPAPEQPAPPYSQ